MYVVFGIERHGHVITEIFLKNKKNITDDSERKYRYE